ncbi:hypothetical protein M441DRAFT_71562 [Trichoderma asperellum CBS 433.97]|uniref:Uncharacterized protein n=1 Tax=Trichoderma asperellum (strain ATCC 204424 / CBS 433.97 / NBRC 101777) TaxID=1042311 RepID=A0A2T3YZU4_TRIA4|nr:hypothetical protein M441DRAFT_71562 [Trichoderma asperellum CBS 433.97]PTB38092.1 hypothetical protein M441DRAFT_71562 [Trichoderma asperellum CBS 433.97]
MPPAINPSQPQILAQPIPARPEKLSPTCHSCVAAIWSVCSAELAENGCPQQLPYGAKTLFTSHANTVNKQHSANSAFSSRLPIQSAAARRIVRAEALTSNDAAATSLAQVPGGSSNGEASSGKACWTAAQFQRRKG